jgi:NADH:ubiquinone oxidoreductase subunit E
MDDIQNVVRDLVGANGNNRSSLLPILQGVVEKQHFLSNEAMVEVAKALNLSTADVYGTASFYAFLETKPRGRFVIRVCKTIVCDMHGKKQILKTIEDLLKIKLGETTHNQKFSLLETNCLGWCHKGPAMLVNDAVYTELTPEKVREIIDSYRSL